MHEHQDPQLRREDHTGVERGPRHFNPRRAVTGQGGDILAWTENAITAREQAAREAARSYGPRWVRPVDSDMVRISDDDIWFQALSEEMAEHIVYNSPESVLRRCAADRKLIRLHGPWTDEERALIGEPASDESCKGCGFNNQEEPMVADYRDCPVLRAVAEGYGWTEAEV